MNIAIILAGGSGTRINSSLPKQYIEVNNKPIFMYSVDTFNNNSLIDRIILVAKENYFPIIRKYIKEDSKKISLVNGGNTRQESVRNALEFLKCNKVNDEDIILIHDSARPLISDKIINDNISACLSYDACVTYVNVNDTIFMSDDIKVSSSLDRSKIKASQTPQTFKFNLIYEAHNKNHDAIVTDDVQMVLMQNKEIHLVEGDIYNFKVTNDLDLALLQSILKNNQ